MKEHSGRIREKSPKIGPPQAEVSLKDLMESAACKTIMPLWGDRIV